MHTNPTLLDHEGLTLGGFPKLYKFSVYSRNKTVYFIGYSGTAKYSLPSTRTILAGTLAYVNWQLTHSLYAMTGSIHTSYNNAVTKGTPVPSFSLRRKANCFVMRRSKLLPNRLEIQ